MAGERPLTPPAACPAIGLENIRKTYGEGDMAVHASAHVDLNVQRGEYVAIMGGRAGRLTVMRDGRVISDKRTR